MVATPSAKEGVTVAPAATSTSTNAAPCALSLSPPTSTRATLDLVYLSLGRVCDLCRKEVCGLYYRCEPCGFDIHPLCTGLPGTVEYAMHPHPLLTLRCGEPRKCAVCQQVCDSWRYTSHCKGCPVDVHLKCALQEPALDRRTSLRIITEAAGRRFTSSWPRSW
ncbi:hypothetical protein ACJRO7_027407 [Eucalyptus globulus]|uniref:DC1 domain-containing protein n=1 Tax=Eucalyptus globulus TaxID=34317 RepID=A0ABD3JX44_EUCGL